MSAKAKFMWTFLAVMMAIRLALPFALKDYINNRLEHLPDYDGQVSDVSLRLMRGGIRLKGLTVVKKGEPPPPLFSAAQIDLNWSWKHLLSREFVGSLNIEAPEVNAVSVPEKPVPKVSVEQKMNEGWREMKTLPPYKITEIRYQNGKITYEDKENDFRLDVADVQGAVTNLANNAKLGENGVATVFLAGRPMGTGSLKINLRINQFAKTPEFKAEQDMSIPVTSINKMFSKPLPLEPSGGDFHTATEIAAADGAFHGYVKPTIDNLDVVDLKKDKKVGEVIKKAVVGAAAAIFKNKWKDRLGTKIPISGRFDDPKVNVWQTVINLLKNAFIQVLPRGVEGSVGLKK